VRVPRIENLAGEICEGTLGFPPIALANQTLTLEQLPRLQIAQGKIHIPMPPGEITKLDILDVDWALNGFPSGTVRLAQDLEVFNQDGFTFTSAALAAS
jgi:hypothetical protein